MAGGVIAGLLAVLFLFAGGTTATTRPRVGVNYGQLGSDLPEPTAAVKLIRSVNAGAVKLYDADPAILSALAGTDLQVSVMLPNSLIPLAAANQSFADAWVAANLAPFSRSVKIRYLLVGNELFSDASLSNSTWPRLVPAMRRLHRALRTHSIRAVKLGTTAAMDVLLNSFPPSAGTFRDGLAGQVIAELLPFLRRTRSFFFLDAYPYFAWAASPGTIDLGYALMDRGADPYTDPGSGLQYTNLLDQQLDAVAAAMARLGFADVRLALAETGWPNGGDYDQAGANPRNAAVYNRNLVRRMTARPPAGTPARPGVAIPTFIFSLFNENRKPGPGTERHWGIFYPNGTEVYGLDLTGKAKLPPPPPAVDNRRYTGKIWCVAAPGAEGNATDLAAAVGYACGQLPETACAPIRAGGSCYTPNSQALLAGYAFNLYWQQFRSLGGTCYFNGLATQTIEDPSSGSCKFPSGPILGN